MIRSHRLFSVIWVYASYGGFMSDEGDSFRSTRDQPLVAGCRPPVLFSATKMSQRRHVLLSSMDLENNCNSNSFFWETHARKASISIVAILL